MSPGTKRRRLHRLLAAVAIVVGVVGGIGIWRAADQRLDDAVAGMARAPVGCDTVLDFDTDGTYLLFVETKGELDGVRGDCDVDPTFEWDEDELPSYTLTLFGPDDAEIDLETDDGVSYDTSTSAGTSVNSVEIDTSGDHVLRVESDDADFVIAVGRNPNDGVLLLRVLAIGIAVAGLVVGAVLLVRASRGSRAATTDDETWVPQPGAGPEWPMSPPGFPVPPPTTGTTAVVGPSTGPGLAPSAAPLPVPPPRPPSRPPSQPPSVAPIPGQPVPGQPMPGPAVPGESARWGPPPPPAGKRPGT